jgi:hypothetical protein
VTLCSSGLSLIQASSQDERGFFVIKQTRDNLGDKEVGNELIIDKEHYSEHQDCKTLVCFVFDPDQRLRNPNGLAKDLEKMSTNNLKIIVKIER